MNDSYKDLAEIIYREIRDHDEINRPVRYKR